MYVFSYMKWYGNEHLREWTLSRAEDRIDRMCRLIQERLETMKYIKKCFYIPLIKSYKEARNFLKKKPLNTHDLDKRYQDLRLELLVLSTKMNNDPRMASKIDIIAFATCYYHLGIIYKEGKLLTLSRKYLITCWKLLDVEMLNPRGILVVVKTLIALSEIAKEEDKEEEEWRCLNNGVTLCLEYFKRDDLPEPICVHLVDVFKNKVERQENLKILLISLYTSIIDRLEMLYAKKSEYSDEWLNCFHNFLSERERDIESPNKRYQWSRAVISLSKQIVQNQRFIEARGYLTAATYMVEMMQRDSSLDTTHNNIVEIIGHLAQGWQIYATHILASSYDHQTNEIQMKRDPDEEERTNLLFFRSLLIEHTAGIVHEITDSPVSDIQDAKEVFRYAVELSILASTCFVRIGCDTQYLSTVLAFIASILYFIRLTTDLQKQISLHEVRRDLLYQIYEEYNQKAEHAEKLRPYLKRILAVWRNGFNTFLSVIHGIPTYTRLFPSLKRELEYIKNMTRYYNQYEE